MTARCGSFTPSHRSRACAKCRAIYDERRRSGRPRFGQRLLTIAARCVFCDLVAGNSQGVRVYRYTLRRSLSIDGKRTSRALGSIGLCDVCLLDYGLVNADRLAA